MRVTEEDRPTKEVRPAVMVARCCCCGVGGSGKKNHRKTAHGDKERLISNGGGGKRRPVSGDSAVSNSTFASATAAGTPHDYEVECDARLEGHKQDEDRVRMAAAADFASAGFSKRSFLSCRPYRKEHARGLYCSYKLRF